MVVNIEKLSTDLEKQELDAWSRNSAPTAQIYAQLLAVYIYQHDLCNAKYLWKRIPANVKASNPELAQVWAVGQHMWKRDYPATYKALSAATWSEPIVEIMKSITENVRSRALNLIAQAYSSLSIEAVALMTGLDTNQVAVAATEQGWVVEPDSRMILPKTTPSIPTGDTSSEDQLYKLTEFVSFLEN